MVRLHVAPQLSYAEIYISELYWPDFDEQELQKALQSFGRRDRRYGAVKNA